MSRVCQVTGKRPIVGNYRLARATTASDDAFFPNLHVQRFWLESEKRFVSLQRIHARTAHDREAWPRRGGCGAARPGRQSLREAVMREKIKLVSSAGTGHYYTTMKNKRLHPDKLGDHEITIRRAQSTSTYKESKIK